MKRKFGELVRDVKVSVDRANNPYEFYVAGDHMDSEDFRIHRKGCFATDDVGPAFIRVFRPGQVLYGSRRTYLKKVCVADFEGVTANTTFVLETKDENVLMQKLLPFIMLSDDFTDWSIKHSKGSTNPYVLFRDLANYEFELPDPSRQKELVDILWAANDLKEKYKQAIAASDEMLKAKFREMFECDGVKTEPCGRLFHDLRNGLSPSRRGSVYAKVLTLTAITQGRFHADEWKDGSFDEVPTSDKRVDARDFYICRGNGNKRLVGLGVSPGQSIPDLVFPDTMIAAKLNQELVLPSYLSFAWNSSKARKQIEGMAKTTNGTYKINQDSISKVKIPLPPLALQQQFVAIAEAVEAEKAALQKSIAEVDTIIKGLING